MLQLVCLLKEVNKIVILVVFVYAIVSSIEIHGLYKNNQVKEIKIYSSLMVISLVISILISLDIHIISPARIIEDIISLFIPRG